MGSLVSHEDWQGSPWCWMLWQRKRKACGPHGLLGMFLLRSDTVTSAHIPLGKASLTAPCSFRVREGAHPPWCRRRWRAGTSEGSPKHSLPWLLQAGLELFNWSSTFETTLNQKRTGEASKTLLLAVRKLLKTDETLSSFHDDLGKKYPQLFPEKNFKATKLFQLELWFWLSFPFLPPSLLLFLNELVSGSSSVDRTPSRYCHPQVGYAATTK